MKEVKQKSSDAEISSMNVIQRNSQATEEQIRYAKLSQVKTMEEKTLQEKIKEIIEITGIPPDMASIALHDCDYDTQTAIQKICDGQYEQEQYEWETTTKKGKGKKASGSNSPMILEDNIEMAQKTTVEKSTPSGHSDTIDLIEEPEQKASTKPSRFSRGGSSINSRGRPFMSRNWRNEEKTQGDKRNNQSHEQDPSFDRPRSFNDRGRGRGRGRAFRGAISRGGRGGRGGFGRGSSRGGPKQERGDRYKRSGFSEHQDADNKKLENGDLEQANDEFWEQNDENVSKIEDWSDDVVDDSPSSDWSKPDWAEPNQPKENNFEVFSNNWPQTNGLSDWGNQKPSRSKNAKEKYIPENIDTAVIRSIPTSSTSGEVTSYQATNDMNRYVSSASDQFPSSHQEGDLTSSLNDRAFCVSSNRNFTDTVKRTVASMPMVSGVTESHKLEEEQLQSRKNERGNYKSRKTHNKFVQLPSQPVVMPRSAQMVNDIEEQFSGLEFGSGPISPGIKRIDEHQPKRSTPLSSTATSIKTVAVEKPERHSVLHESKPPLTCSKPAQDLPSETILSSAAVKPPGHVVTKSDIPKTPPGFKPLDHYLGLSTNSNAPPGLSQIQHPDAISFPSSKNHTSSSNSSTLNSVFGRSGGLGAILAVPDANSSTYKDPYDREKAVSAEKVLAQQRALAEKQYLAEQQRLAEQREKERMMTDQLAFAERKSLAQQNLLSSHKSQEDGRKVDISDGKSIVESTLGLREVKEPSSAKSSSKIQSSSTSSTGSSRNASQHNTTVSNVSNEILGLSSASGVQTTAKAYTSGGKISSAPPGVLHQQMNLYASVQAGMLPYQQRAVTGYSYDDLLQIQGLPVSPYGYDISLYQAPPGSAISTRDGLQTYAATDPKFTRGSDDTSVAMAGNPHLAAAPGNMTAHQQAYLNGQFPYGITYAYQPGVMQQGGVFPPSPALYQVQQSKSGTQYPSQQYSQQQPPPPTGYNNVKFSSGTSSHEFNKGSYYTQAQGNLSQVQHGGQHVKQQQPPATSSGSQSTVHQAVPQSAYKPHYNTDGKGFIGSTLSSLNAQQAGLHLNQAHLNQFLLQQQQVSAAQLVDPNALRNQVHGNQVHGQMPKRDKGSYQSFWSGVNH